MPKSLILPASSLDAFFAEEAKPMGIRSQNFNLDGIIRNLQKYNDEDLIGRGSSDDNGKVVDRLDVVIERLDALIKKNGPFGGSLLGGLLSLRTSETKMSSRNSLTRTFEKITSGLKENSSRLIQFGKEGIVGSLRENILKTKEIFSGYSEAITSSFSGIKEALSPKNFGELLSAPIKSFMTPIQNSIAQLKKDVTNVFEGVGDIIAAPFRMVGNLTSFLFKKDKGYPFERLEKDIDFTNRTVTAIEKAIREVLIKQLQFNILSKITNIDERLGRSEIATSADELKQIEISRETARLEDQRADRQNELLSSIAEKIETLGVVASKQTGKGGTSEESGGLSGKLTGAVTGFLKKAAIPAIGVGLGISAMGDVSENYQKNIKGEATFEDYLGTIGKSTAAGAAMGSWFGPYGTLVGGAIGAGVGGAASLITALTPSQKEAEEKRAKAWEDQQNEIALKSLEERGMLDRNIFGESKIDESKLSTMSVRELTALASLDDFSAKDVEKIQQALEKRKELDSKVQEESKKKTEESKAKAQTQYQGMTNEEQIAKLESEKSRVVEQLKTAKASESQIQQVTRNFDKKILELRSGKSPDTAISAPGTPGTPATAISAPGTPGQTERSREISDQIQKLQIEKETVVDRLKTAKASESQIQQVTRDFDRKISELMSGSVDATISSSIRTPVPETGIRPPQDVTTVSQVEVAKGTIDTMAMKAAGEVGTVVSPTLISSNSSNTASSIVVNAPSTTVNTAKGNTFLGIKPTISMNN